MKSRDSSVGDYRKSLSSVDWDHLKALFNKARTLRPEERARFVAEECREDPEMRSELDLLLSTYEDAPAYFGELADEFGGAVGRSFDSSDRLIGQTISHYTILDLLGSGGMGSVYKARHTTLEQPVALKFLSSRFGADQDAKRRFIEEAKAAYAIDHPNICTIYDIDETDSGQIYIAMAYYEGETLAETIRRGPLPVGHAIDIGAQICEGLAKAHGSGIVHCDVKPSNVMITREGTVKLLDFGVAQIAGGLEDQSRRRLGTVAYMSPEQCRGESLDHRTDLWSVGVLLCEMVHGKHPFRSDGDSVQAVIHAILNRSPLSFVQTATDESGEVDQIIRKCLEKAPDQRYRAAALLFADLHRAGQALKVSQSRAGSKVFLVYRRGAEPDERLAGAIKDALEDDHVVHTGGGYEVSRRWIEQLEDDLAASDFLIALLSADASHDEMIIGEIEAATRLTERRGFGPAILAVRIDFSEPLPYPLSRCLEGLNMTYWQDDGDTPRLLDDLKKALGGARLSTPAGFNTGSTPGSFGFPPPASKAQPFEIFDSNKKANTEAAFYVERQTDLTALRAVEHDGSTITIKGPRQMGKSSLLTRIAERAQALGKTPVLLDFHTFEEANLRSADRFFRRFCTRISDSLGVDDRVADYWRRPVANPHRCTRYLSRHVLRTFDRPVLLAMDEIELLFETSFRFDFFGMLRSWHNDRAVEPVWRRLDLVLATSTEPYELAKTPNLSPFNVGEVVSLEDFSADQTIELNRRYGEPLSTDEVLALVELLNGHPYMTRKALYLVAAKRVSFGELLQTASDQHGPFEDHLNYHLYRLRGRDDLVDGLRTVLRRQSCENEEICWALLGAGLVRRDGGSVVPRCRLYDEYFRRRLLG